MNKQTVQPMDICRCLMNALTGFGREKKVRELVRRLGLEPRPLVGCWYQPAHLGRQFPPALQVRQEAECDGDRIEVIPVG
jgi:hypothetical protein